MITVALVLALQANASTCPPREQRAAAAASRAERVKSLFAQRRAILERQRKLAGANPVSRGVGSIFDANQNPSELRRRDALLAQQIDLEVQEGQFEAAMYAGCQD